MVRSPHQAGRAVGATATLDGAGAPLASSAGPLTIPPDVTHTLRTLADEAGVDDFVPLWACACVVADRLARWGGPRRARLAYSAREATTVSLDPAASFRATLRRAAEYGVPAVPDPRDDSADATIWVSVDGYCLYVETSDTSADAPLPECWARLFRQTLACLANDPDAPAGGHPLVDDDERERILRGLNAYRAPAVTYRTMTQPFEEQAARTPGAVALVGADGTTVTYRELDERANRLAHYLRGLGAGPGTRVGVCLERGIDQVVAIYAAVKSGSAYVPLDADLPDERLAYMLADAAPTHVLTDAACRPRIPGGDWRVHDVRAGAAAWAACPATTPDVDVPPGALLNILYTSGTTGRPKGVAYPTDGALAHLAWMQGRYPFHAGDAAVFKTSPGFDVSIWELFWPLYHGGRLVICRPGGHGDPGYLARLVEDHGVTTIFLAPTVMTPFLDKVDPARAGALRWALCGGEPITPRVRDTFYTTLPGTMLVNCYGPTEAGNVTDMPLEPDIGSPAVPLGRPAGNFRVTILDEKLDLVPVGLPGEAYISAETGLAQAYWRAPARTAERFVADPFGPPGSRMYRTGDLCRYRDDGVLQHLGRIDRQVKIRGLRIEPGEIESVLAAHPSVTDCAVVVPGSPPRLLAFVVPADGAPEHFDTAAVVEHAARLMPRHMRPESVVAVERIPANVNGKIDKDALLAVWEARAEPERDIEPPADDVETALVEIYGRLLETWPVSVLDNFTQLGGHSLLAFQLLDECAATFGAKPDVTDLLAGTVRDVAASIRTAKTTPAAAEPAAAAAGGDARKGTA